MVGVMLSTQHYADMFSVPSSMFFRGRAVWKYTSNQRVQEVRGVVRG